MNITPIPPPPTYPSTASTSLSNAFSTTPYNSIPPNTPVAALAPTLKLDPIHNRFEISYYIPRCVRPNDPLEFWAIEAATLFPTLILSTILDHRKIFESMYENNGIFHNVEVDAGAFSLAAGTYDFLCVQYKAGPPPPALQIAVATSALQGYNIT